MKVYIAGKITGDPGYRDKLAAAEIQLGWQGHAVLNPAELPGGMRKIRNARLQAMSAMAGFWAVCIFTIRKNKPLKHGTGGRKEHDEAFL